MMGDGKGCAGFETCFSSVSKSDSPNKSLRTSGPGRCCLTSARCSILLDFCSGTTLLSPFSLGTFASCLASPLRCKLQGQCVKLCLSVYSNNKTRITNNASVSAVNSIITACCGWWVTWPRHRFRLVFPLVLKTFPIQFKKKSRGDKDISSYFLQICSLSLMHPVIFSEFEFSFSSRNETTGYVSGVGGFVLFNTYRMSSLNLSSLIVFLQLLQWAELNFPNTLHDLSSIVAQTFHLHEAFSMDLSLEILNLELSPSNLSMEAFHHTCLLLSRRLF